MKRTIFIIFLSMVIISCSSQNGPYIKTDKYLNGNVQFSYTYDKGMPNGKYEAYYEDGKIRAIGMYKDGDLSGQFVNFDENSDTTSIETWVSGRKMKEVIFYQEYPDNSYRLISKKGFVTENNGIYTDFGKDTPNGYLEKVFDTKTKATIYYIWQNSERKLLKQ